MIQNSKPHGQKSDGAVYIHSAPEGKKITLLARNPHCCFEVDICDRIVRGERSCSWGMWYRSVIGFGSAQITEDPEERIYALNCFMRHYDGGTCEFSKK